MTWWLPVSDGVAHATPVDSESTAIELAQRRFGAFRAARTWQVLPVKVTLPVGVVAPWAEKVVLVGPVDAIAAGEAVRRDVEGGAA